MLWEASHNIYSQTHDFPVNRSYKGPSLVRFKRSIPPKMYTAVNPAL